MAPQASCIWIHQKYSTFPMRPILMSLQRCFLGLRSPSCLSNTPVLSWLWVRGDYIVGRRTVSPVWGQEHSGPNAPINSEQSLSQLLSGSDWLPANKIWKSKVRMLYCWPEMNQIRKVLTHFCFLRGQFRNVVLQGKTELFAFHCCFYIWDRLIGSQSRQIFSSECSSTRPCKRCWIANHDFFEP